MKFLTHGNPILTEQTELKKGVDKLRVEKHACYLPEKFANSVFVVTEKPRSKHPVRLKDPFQIKKLR